MRRWWTALGGPCAITIWSWIATFPLALALGVSGGLILAMPLDSWLIAVVIVQVLLILPLVVARATILNGRPRRARPVTAIVVFSLLGAFRALALAWYAVQSGADITMTLLAGWVLNGGLFGVAALSAIAIVVDGLRHHRDVMSRLATLRAGLDSATREQEKSLAQLESEVLDEVEKTVAESLSNIRQELSESPTAAAAAMRVAAETVIRPLSHRLAEDDMIAVHEPPQQVDVPWRMRASNLLSVVRPTHPLLPAAVIEVLGLPYLLDRTNPPFVVTNLLVGGGCLVLLSWVIRRIWGQRQGSAFSTLLLTMAYALVGGIAAWVSAVVARALGIEAPLLGTTAIFFPAIAMFISLMTALDIRRAQVEDETAHVIVHQASQASSLRQRISALRRRLARILHSSVQGEFIASSMSISGWAQSDPESIQREIERLSNVVTQRLRESPGPQGSPEEYLTDLLSLWEGMLEITLDVAPDTWHMLEERIDLQHDMGLVVAEGLTNAVRHGQGRQVDVKLGTNSDELNVRVESDGRLDQRISPGLGSRTMDEFAVVWSLRETEDRVLLEATLR